MRFLNPFYAIMVLALALPSPCRNPSYLEAKPRSDKQDASVLPLEVAFSRKQIRPERPGFSSNGKWFAYEVYSPPPGGVNSQPYLPNGVPSYVIGLQLDVLPVEGGPTRSVCRHESNCWRPSWSPDGQFLAYYSDSGGLPQLWVYDLERQTSRRLSDVRIKARPWWIDKPAWSPDSREIFVPVDLSSPVRITKEAETGGPPSKDTPKVQVFRTARGGAMVGDVLQDRNNERLNRQNNSTLAGIDLVSGRMRVVLPADSQPQPSSLKLSPDGQWISYLSVFRTKGESEIQAYYDLAIVSVTGGKPIPVDLDLEITDRDYFGEPYLWSSDGMHLLYTKARQLWVADIGRVGVQKPHLLNENLGELNDEPFALSSSGKTILVGLKPTGEKAYYRPASATLALVPLDGSELKLLQAEGAPITWNSTTLWQPEATTIYLLQTDAKAATHSIVRLDIDGGGVTTVWNGKGRMIATGTKPDGDSLVVRYESMTTPPDFFRFIPKSGRMEQLTHTDPRLAEISIGPTETFETTIPGLDGQPKTVQSSIFLPPNVHKGDRLPTVVSFYGGLPASVDSQDYGGGERFSIPIPIFTTRGYAVLVVDCPLGPEGVGGNPIQEMTDTILPQVYHAIELGYTDLNHIAIAGHSYGGYGTAGVVTQTKLFRAAIALDGVYDLGGNYAHMSPDGTTSKFRWSETGQGRMGTHPWADLNRYIGNSPYYLADKVSTPLLLIHGESDTASPVEESQKMFTALKRLNKTAELATYRGEGHLPGSWSLADAVDATQRILDFLDRYVRLSNGVENAQGRIR